MVKRNRDEEFDKAYTGIHESRMSIVYPFVGRQIRQNQASSVLDFGGGDASFLVDHVAKTASVAHFDISPAMRQMARSNLADRENAVVFNKASEIPSDAFDCVVAIAVWMELPSKRVAVNVLRSINRAMKREAKLIAAVTHPCFREESYSSFKTNFSNASYLKSGLPFEATISDGTNEVIFCDFHWNLQDMSMQLAQADMRISGLYELGDAPRAGVTTRGSPWLILEATKSQHIM